MAEDNFVLKAENISKRFINPAGASLSVLQQTSLYVKEGELLCILGPSFSGKSTLLRILAGIEEPDSGSVQFAQYENLRANLALIPSEPSSLPWLNVRENVRLGLKEAEKEEEVLKGRISRAISTVGLEGYESHIPANKSTGFRFRIALARALAMDPKVILIDDPLRDLLPERKIGYYRLIRDILSKEKVSIVWVTTDVTEALLLSERILVLASKPGRIMKEFSLGKRSLPGPADLEKEEYCRIRKEIETLFYAGFREFSPGIGGLG